MRQSPQNRASSSCVKGQHSGDQEVARKGALTLERQGLECVPEEARTARPSQLFWPWFSSNVSVFSMSYGAFLLGFGISPIQAILAGVVGIVLSFLLCGGISIAGKRSNVPTMVLSRATFGVYGQRVVGVISWMTSLGWETFLAIAAVLATATVFNALGWEHGKSVLLLATLVVAGVIALMAVLGYHAIMRLQAILTWVTGIATLVFLLLILPDIHWGILSQQASSGPLSAVIGASVMAMTGFGLGWINIAADWTRYQSRTTHDGAIVFWNVLGGSTAPIVLVMIGILLAGSSGELSQHIGDDPVGTLVSLLPLWALVPFWIIALLTLVSGAVLGIYSSGLTLLSLGVRVPRPWAAGIDSVLLTLGTLSVVFFSTGFLASFQSFLLTLGVPLAAWAGLAIADTSCRKVPYQTQAFYDPHGLYGDYDFLALGILLIASAIGWGLVVNGFSAQAHWNDWQGYLLWLLGGKRALWASANIGVPVALIIGFIGGMLFRRSKIARQEMVAIHSYQEKH